MKLLNLSVVLALLSLTSCASFEDKHQCNSWTVKVRDSNYRFCSPKDNNKTVGLAYGNSGKWLLEPVYTRIETFQAKEIHAIKEVGGGVKYNFNTGEMEDTDYLGFFSASNQNQSNSKGIMYARFKNQTDIAVVYADGNHTPTKINNVDSPVYSAGTGESISPVYSSKFKGLYVRQKEGDRKYYKMYNYSCGPISPEFPEEEIKILYSYGSLNIHFFHRIDKENDLYWPLFPDSNSYFKKPDYLKGIIILPEMYYDTDTPRAFPTYKALGFVFHGEKGKEDYVVFKYTNNEDHFVTLDEFKKLIDASRASEKRYYDYSFAYGKVAGFTGKKILDQKYIIVRNADNRYGYSDDVAWITNDFADKNEVIANIDNITANVDISALNNQKNRMQDEVENQATRARISAEVNNDIRKEKEILAQDKAEYEAARKAEDAKIWNSVSDQIKGAADKSKTKADCIRKNTQTKKDFLAKKQGWYQTGGCD